MFDMEGYIQADTVKTAIRLLTENPQALLIAGGTDVLIKLREGKLENSTLVSIHDIKELSQIEKKEDGTICIGSCATFSYITNHPLIKEHLPMLGEAVDLVGGPQIRNMGTIGGNICNGAVSADSAPALLAYNAVLELTGPEGVRELPLCDFYTGPGKTIRLREEILTSIKIHREDYEGFGGQYLKYGKRNAMEISTLGCAALVRLSQDKKQILDFRLAFGVAAPTPIRCPKTEALVNGLELENPNLNSIITEGVLKEVQPRSSWRASKEFRLQLVRELSIRATSQAIVNAGGENHA